MTVRNTNVKGLYVLNEEKAREGVDQALVKTHTPVTAKDALAIYYQIPHAVSVEGATKLADVQTGDYIVLQDVTVVFRKVPVRNPQGQVVVDEFANRKIVPTQKLRRIKDVLLPTTLTKFPYPKQAQYERILDACEKSMSENKIPFVDGKMGCGKSTALIYYASLRYDRVALVVPTTLLAENIHLSISAFFRMKESKKIPQLVVGIGASPTNTVVVATSGHIKKLYSYKIFFDEAHIIREFDLKNFTLDVVTSSIVMSATIATPLYAQYKDRSDVHHIETQKEYGLIGTVEACKIIKEIPHNSLLYGNYAMIEGGTPVQFVSKDTTQANFNDSRLMLPFHLAAGFNPPFDVCVAFVNFSVSLSCATNYPGVFKTVSSTSASMADLVQVMGRIHRPYKQNGIVFTTADPMAIFRARHILPETPKLPSQLQFIDDCYRGLTVPPVKLVTQPEHNIAHPAYYKIVHGRYVLINGGKYVVKNLEPGVRLVAGLYIQGPAVYAAFQCTDNVGHLEKGNKNAFKILPIFDRSLNKFNIDVVHEGGTNHIFDESTMTTTLALLGIDKVNPRVIRKYFTRTTQLESVHIEDVVKDYYLTHPTALKDNPTIAIKMAPFYYKGKKYDLTYDEKGDFGNNKDKICLREGYKDIEYGMYVNVDGQPTTIKFYEGFVPGYYAAVDMADMRAVHMDTFEFDDPVRCTFKPQIVVVGDAAHLSNGYEYIDLSKEENSKINRYGNGYTEESLKFYLSQGVFPKPAQKKKVLGKVAERYVDILGQD